VSASGGQLRTFISYRRSDTQSAGRQLADALKRRFGAESVFFDTKDLGVGEAWRGGITERVSSADVVLVLVGPRWVAIADERGRRMVLDPEEEDVLRLEIETALRGDPLVVPVLVDDAEMPAREMLPRPFKPVPGLQAATLRHASWEQDVEALMASLEERVAARRRRPEASGEDLAPIEALGVPPDRAAERPVASASAPPDPSHYERVARHVATGTLVPVLGPGANASDGPWHEGCGSLPDGDELARHLARQFDLDPEPGDLARVSQHISLTEGDIDLYRELREVLIKADYEPGPVHRFLARLPAMLRDRRRERYPLIVTTNYDTALEQAFAAVHEPFDLLVFMATGENKGRFLHVPWWDGDGLEPKPIMVPNQYVDLPIDEDLELARTVLVKIYGGAVYEAPREYQLKNNFVVTEDDYIGYLSRSPVESLIPIQVLNKLRESHFLFLGYGMRNWSVRVFLRRIWSEQHLGAKSWAIQPSLGGVEREFWEKLDVERLEVPLSTYVNELEDQLAPPSGLRGER
jgi:hypothetical protein